MGEGLPDGRLPLSARKGVEREFGASAVLLQIVHQRLFIREIVAAYVDDGETERDRFYGGAIPGLGENQVDRCQDLLEG